MSGEFVATNAASSGIALERKRLKALASRSDRPGLIFLGQWSVLLAATGYLIWLSSGSFWIWPAMAVYGTCLVVPAYALSHETAHGTAFKTRWLNELVFWVTSLIYVEEPLHRRYTHTSHHTYTYHIERDAQIPHDLPMTFSGWAKEILGLAHYIFTVRFMLNLALQRPSPMLRQVAPPQALAGMARNAQWFLLIYAGLAGLILSGQSWLLWFLVFPRLLGGVMMSLFGLIQHAEMKENSWSIIDSTRSFRTNRFIRLLYLNMNFHIEHHLFPQVPFYHLADLNQEIAPQLPAPDPGFFRTNLEILSVVIRRSLGRNTRAKSIRQAPERITSGGFTHISKATM